jgi:NAD-dependent deacetylase
MSLEERIERAAELVRQAQHMVAFTGAGHSTPSGIPDFRSPGSGLWEKANPMAVASIWAFRLNPRSFYDWIRPLMPVMLEAEPNPAHFALADLETRGILKAVITQNIDNLHQRAGSQRVLELHGHMREATCVRCYREVAVDPLIEDFLQNNRVPRCECGGVLKPNVILFGEQLPVRVYNQAMEEASHCDLMLVAGSSMTVTPAADLPYIALQNRAKAIIVNFYPTGFDQVADLVIHGDVTEVLPAIVEAL